MDEKQELGDILITEDISTNTSNTKKMILLGAAAILLLLIILFAFYSMSNKGAGAEESSQEALLNKQGLEKLDAKEPNTEANAPKFEQVPIKEEAKPESADKFEEIVRQIKEKEAAVTADEVKELPAPPKVEQKEVATPTPPPAPAPAKPATVEKPAASAPSGNVPKGYYIQVGAFSNNPDKAFLSMIEKNGYNYKILKLDTGIKVLVGPFASKTEASQKINDVRAKIAKGAFIKSL